MQGKDKVILFFAFALSGVIYAITINSYFIAGDFTHLEPKSFKEVMGFFTAFRQHPELLTREFRPTAETFYALEVFLFGLKPFYYHLTSLFLHWVMMVLIYNLAKPFSIKAQFAALSAFFFGIHPALVNIVSWIAVQGDQLCGIFYLLSLIILLRHSNSQHLNPLICIIISYFFFILSLLFKEMAITLPFAILLIWHFGQKIGFFPQRKSFSIVAGFFLILSFYWAYRILVLGGIGGYGSGQHLKIGRFLLTNLLTYIQWIIGLFNFPQIMYKIADMIFPIPLILALIYFVFPLKNRLFFLLMGISLLPVYNILKLTNLYIPIAWFVIFCGSIIQDLFNWAKIKGKLRFSAALILLIIVYSSIYFFRAINRANDYRQASNLAEGIIIQIKDLKPDLPKGAKLGFIGLPDMHQGVFALGIGIQSAMRLIYQDSGIKAFKIVSFQDLARMKEAKGGEIYLFHIQNDQVLLRPDLLEVSRNQVFSPPPPKSLMPLYIWSKEKGEFNGWEKVGEDILFEPSNGWIKQGEDVNCGIISPPLSLNPKMIEACVIKMEIRSVMPEGEMRLSWISDKDPIWDDAKMWHMPIKHNIGPISLQMPLNNLIMWKSQDQIIRLKFRPTNKKATVLLERIELLGYTQFVDKE